MASLLHDAIGASKARSIFEALVFVDLQLQPGVLPSEQRHHPLIGPLALLGVAFHPVLVHRLAAAFHASFAVINLREDLHLQECARARRARKRRRGGTCGVWMDGKVRGKHSLAGNSSRWHAACWAPVQF